MTLSKTKLVLLGSFLLFGLPFFSFAAITYSRTPSSSSFSGSATFNVSVANFSDFGLDPLATYYRLVVEGVQDDGDFEGPCNSASTLSISNNFDFYPGYRSQGVYIYAFTDAACGQDANPSVYYVEGNGTATIFNAPGSRTAVATKSVIAHRPEVAILFPKEGNFISGTTTIKYDARDEDNALYPPFGFGEKPIDIYYSEDQENWIRVIEKSANTGEFLWDTSKLFDGKYWLKIRGRDEGGESDEEISGPFEKDIIPPIFDISVDPPVSRGEKVKITVKVSEPLLQSPDVVVRQRNYTDIPVFVQPFEILPDPPLQKEGEIPPLLKGGEGGFVWQGTYEVRQGADGTAKITIKGKDRAGNESSTIRKGGYFSVGVEPPPTPIIVSPLNNEVATSSSISILGRIREDTQASIFVNDLKIGSFKPNTEGDFVAGNIQLSKDVNRGLNIVKIFSEDGAGNLSEPAVLNLKFNLAPKISILEPTAEATTSATTTIVIEARDDNQDRLSFTIEISSDGGLTFQEIVKDYSRPSFQWNTREFLDGEYILRVTAFDGFEKVTAISSVFSVRNFLPVILIDKKVYTNKPELVLNGSVASPFPRGDKERLNVVKMDMSRDNGKTWQIIQASDGVFDSPVEEFTLRLENLTEGEHEVIFRSFNTQGLRGRARVTIIADFTLPSAPVISLPQGGAVLSDQADTNENLAGVQFDVLGTSEPESEIKVTLDDKTFTGRTTLGGEFKIKGVTFREHGPNELKIIATDRALNLSSEAKLSLTYNNPPVLKFLRPRNGEGLNHKSMIKWEVQDPDLDKIQEIRLSYRKGEAGELKTITMGVDIKETFWEVGNLLEGEDYELRLEATDGVSSGVEIIRVFVDNTAPLIRVEPLPVTSFKQKFTLEARGSASDNFSGIQFVEYKIDRQSPKSIANLNSNNLETDGIRDNSRDNSGGDLRQTTLNQWFKSTITRGFRTNDASFRVRHPFSLADGEYDFKIRSIDVAGNISEEFSQKIIVDTTPPRIGSYTISVGPFSLLPEGEAFEIVEGTELKLRISLEEDTASSTIYIGGEALGLQKRVGFWVAETSTLTPTLPLDGEGEGGGVPIFISATDYLGNITAKKEIGKIKILPKGRILSLENQNPLEGVKMNISIFDESSNSWLNWQAEAYGFQNPILSDADGKYSLLLPNGKYEISLRKSGFKRIKVSVVEVLNPKFIAQDFIMESRRGIRGFLEEIIENIGGSYK